MDINKIVILTGAGISAESGIPTFRDSDGLWMNHSIQDVATPDGFKRNPDLVHSFYNKLRSQICTSEPNAAHVALAEFSKKFGGSVIIATQNIDDLHEKAGSENVYHMHGKLDEIRCVNKGTIIKTETDHTSNDRCKCCAEPARLRPNITWFSEVPNHIEDIYSHISDCEMFIAIGTSGNVYPAAGLVNFAKEFNAVTISLNLELPENNDMFDFSYTGPGSVIVPAFFKNLLE